MRRQGADGRYFIWDTLDSALHSTLGFVVHGTSLHQDFHESKTDDQGQLVLLSTCSHSYVLSSSIRMKLIVATLPSWIRILFPIMGDVYHFPKYLLVYGT